MEKLLFRSIREHAAAFSSGEYTSEQLTRAFLQRSEVCEGRICAYLTVDAEGALLEARASDERRRRGECLGPLDGIPYAVKDNFCTKNLRTNCASRMLESYRPPYDAEAVCRLRRAGAVLLGKLNLDEFAMGSSTEHSALGRTRNPYGEDRVAGGSSGGSAAAVAAGECVFSLGTDTGGSIRQPAAFCGVLGLKPTYGLISRYGVIALASSLDCVGVFSRSAEDGETVLSALAGRDEKDMTTLDVPPSPIPDRPLRVAVVSDFLEEGMVSQEIRDRLLSAVSHLRASGVEIGEVTLRAPSMALAAYSVLTSAEAASELGRYDGVRYGLSRAAETPERLYAQSRGEGLGSEVKRRILFGTYVLTGDNREALYDRTRRVRLSVKKAMEEILSSYDLILAPATPTSAFPANARRTPAEMYRSDLCTVCSSLAGLPSLAIPVGFDREGLPLSLQLTGAPFSEPLLYRASALLEVNCHGSEKI
ncbi:MAG: Asp-tRNA(Asn)/Glu-tRNA(Gln) amidotransferase subunit GatA [Clostridia bacterium]|nr:Asp-tRNA(Asn)/Glu-tRNA(Gln) amidotransferase subunit GatA [Clostridia bacterium]